MYGNLIPIFNVSFRRKTQPKNNNKMEKYTTEEFDRFLDSFRENNVALMHSAVRLVTSNGL